MILLKSAINISVLYTLLCTFTAIMTLISLVINNTTMTVIILILSTPLIYLVLKHFAVKTIILFRGCNINHTDRYTAVCNIMKYYGLFTQLIVFILGIKIGIVVVIYCIVKVYNFMTCDGSLVNYEEMLNVNNHHENIRSFVNHLLYQHDYMDANPNLACYSNFYDTINVNHLDRAIFAMVLSQILIYFIPMLIHLSEFVINIIDGRLKKE